MCNLESVEGAGISGSSISDLPTAAPVVPLYDCGTTMSQGKTNVEGHGTWTCSSMRLNTLCVTRFQMTFSSDTSNHVPDPGHLRPLFRGQCQHSAARCCPSGQWRPPCSVFIGRCHHSAWVFNLGHRVCHPGLKVKYGGGGLAFLSPAPEGGVIFGAMVFG